MKLLLPLRLGVAVLLAMTSLPLPAADVPKLISPPATPTLSPPPKETAGQRAARHTAELQAAEARINALVKEFPLLTGPGREENFGKFRLELRRLQGDPTFPRRPEPVSPPAGKAPGTLKTPVQFQQNRRAAELALMRRQAERVLVRHPELKDYIEQQFQWHQRLFEVQDQYPGNPKVRQLVQNRLEVVVVPAAAQP